MTEKKDEQPVEEQEIPKEDLERFEWKEGDLQLLNPEDKPKGGEEK